MGEKRESIEEFARREAGEEAARQAARAEREQSAGKLAAEVPQRFFELCGLVREMVRRFNSAADPQKRLTWRESPALAARDANMNADFNCAFGRGDCEVTLALNAMSRSGKPDVYVVEGSGRLGRERFLLRLEGYAQGGKVLLRVTIDFKRIEVALEELAERLVLAVVKADFNQLYRA